MSSEFNAGLDRVLVLEVTRVTEAAAIAAARLRGRGQEKAADKAAVDAMRSELARLAISGTVVIGEGEMDEAPMLYIGEKVGSGDGPQVDIAVDPLEGTTICAKDMPNSLAVLAISDKGGFLHAPDIYMDKIAIGPGYTQGLVDLDATPADNINALAKAKGVPASEISACILDRPRHAELIAAVRQTGASVRLISDGDIAGVIWTTDPEETGIDIYLGSGGRARGRARGGVVALYWRADAGAAPAGQRCRTCARGEHGHFRRQQKVPTGGYGVGRRDRFSHGRDGWFSARWCALSR